MRYASILSDFFKHDRSDQLECLLECIDALDNSVSIYDSKGHLLYANKAFCNTFAINDFSAVKGLVMTDIIIKNGYNNTNSSAATAGWKLFDVLKTGEAVKNWEVRLEYQGQSKTPIYVCNDLYPIKDENGNVLGLIEIARLREQDLALVKSVIGNNATYTFEDILGDSIPMYECKKAAMHYADTPFPFLLTGESGTGKELFAHSIHNYSSRRSGPFIAVNCANFPEGLIESELFGYVGGSFTGASKQGQLGKFELANGGTLFLDEIGELPLNFQSKFLRVLETWSVTRLGSSNSTPVNVRLIAATNRNLTDLIEEGMFRSDLYYRLQVLTINIPPLRERTDDLLILSNNFLKAFSLNTNQPRKILSSGALYELQKYDWPGNIRELRNVINRACLLTRSDTISKEDIHASIYGSDYSPARDSYNAENLETQTDGEQNSYDSIAEIRKKIDDNYAELLKEALALSGNNRTKAAERLGISRKTLYRIMEKYHLE